MNREELIKRQSELTKEFDELSMQRAKMAEAIKDTEAKMNQLTGAYNEVQRQIDKLKEDK